MTAPDPTQPPASSGNLPATDAPKKAGYKSPPVETRFGGPRAPKAGRKPKSIDQVRKLAVEIGNQPLGETGLTRIQALLISMSSSKNPRDRELFLKYAYGNVKDEVAMTVKQEKIEPYDYESAIAAIAARPNADSPAPSESESDSDGAALGEDADGG